MSNPWYLLPLAYAGVLAGVVVLVLLGKDDQE